MLSMCLACIPHALRVWFCIRAKVHACILHALRLVLHTCQSTLCYTFPYGDVDVEVGYTELAGLALAYRRAAIGSREADTAWA